MTLRELIIAKIVEFEFQSGKTMIDDSFIKLTDEELLKSYRNNVYDEGYADGHCDGYSVGIDENSLPTTDISLLN